MPLGLSGGVSGDRDPPTLKLPGRKVSLRLFPFFYLEPKRVFWYNILERVCVTR